jgi:outer membrane protein TolC
LFGCPIVIFGIKLKQGITTTADFNPELLNNPENIENFNTRIEISQPLINPEGFVQRSATKDYYRASEQALNRTMHYVEYEVKRTYTDLWLAHQSIETIETALKAALEALKVAKDNQEAGYLLESEVIEAELYVLDFETRLEESRNNLRQTSDRLRFLLQLDGNEILNPAASPEIPDISTTNIPGERLTDRSDFQAIAYQIAGNKKMLRASKFKFMPSLNAQFGYEWNDATIFGTGANNYLLGVSLRWTLFDGYKSISQIQEKRSAVERLSLHYEQQQAEADLNIKQASHALNVALKKKAMAERSVERSEALLELTRNRYEEGLEKTKQLLASESTLSIKKLEALEAKYVVITTAYQLEFLTEQNINQQ